jgi:peptidoglycan/xylan/chitin deacetylase (PgdA/CDA1 family)
MAAKLAGLGRWVVALLRRTRARALRARARLSGRPVGIVLCYHDVAVTAGDPARELVPPHAAATVAAQLRHLQRAYRVVPAADIVVAMRSRRRGGRIPAAVTFDDDLPCHAGIVLDVLGEAGSPATFFLTGRGLDAPTMPWWVALDAIAQHGLQAPDAQRLAERIGCGVDDLHRDRVRRVGRLVEALAPLERARLETDLAAAADGRAPAWGLERDAVRQIVERGHEIGFHTLRHDPLQALSDEALQRAMRDGRDDLETAAGRPIRLISYPHGKADARVWAAADAAGFALGFTGNGHPASAEADPRAISRLEPTWLPRGHFELQVARTARDHAEPHTE